MIYVGILFVLALIGLTLYLKKDDEKERLSFYKEMGYEWCERQLEIADDVKTFHLLRQAMIEAES